MALFCTYNESPGIGPRTNCASGQHHNTAYLYGGMTDNNNIHALRAYCPNRFIWTKELGTIKGEPENGWTAEKIIPENCLLEVGGVQMLVESTDVIYLMAGSSECQEDSAKNMYIPNESIVKLERQQQVGGNTSIVTEWKRANVCGVKIDEPALLLHPVLAIVTIGAEARKHVVLYGGQNTSVYISSPLDELSLSLQQSNLMLQGSVLVFTQVAGVVGTGGWWLNGIGAVNGDKMFLFGGVNRASKSNQGCIEVDLSNLDGGSADKSLAALEAARAYEHRNIEAKAKKPRRNPSTNLRGIQTAPERKLITTKKLQSFGKPKLKLFIQHKDTLASNQFLSNWPSINVVCLHISTRYPVLGKVSLVNLTLEEFNHFVHEQEHLNANPKSHELFTWVGQLVNQAIANAAKEHEAYVYWDDEWRPDDFEKKLQLVRKALFV